MHTDVALAFQMREAQWFWKPGACAASPGRFWLGAEQLRAPTQAEDRGAGREGGGSARASAAPTVFSPRSVSPVTRLMLSSQTSFPDRAHSSEAGTLGLWCSLPGAAPPV